MGNSYIAEKIDVSHVCSPVPLFKHDTPATEKNRCQEESMTVTDPASARQRMGVKLSHDPITGEPVAGLFLLRPNEPEPDQPNLILGAADIRQVIVLLEDTLDELERRPQ
jgi:hypothetical protein